MINPGHKLSISRQAELLEMSRSTIYYRPCPISDGDLMLMRRIDELHMTVRLQAAACCATCSASKVLRWAAATCAP